MAGISIYSATKSKSKKEIPKKNHIHVCRRHRHNCSREKKKHKAQPRNFANFSPYNPPNALCYFTSSLDTSSSILEIYPWKVSVCRVHQACHCICFGPSHRERSPLKVKNSVPPKLKKKRKENHPGYFLCVRHPNPPAGGKFDKRKRKEKKRKKKQDKKKSQLYNLR